MTASRTGASRLPSPPESTSSSGTAPQPDDNLQARPQSAAHDGQTQAYMDPSAHNPAQGVTGNAATNSAQSKPVIPSPASDTQEGWAPGHQVDRSVASSENNMQQTTIHVRDLAHVEALARTHMPPSGAEAPPLQAMKYEISGMPIGDIIEMVAALLTKITTTNDLQQDTLNRNAIERNASHVKQAQAQNDGSAKEHNMSPFSSSVLAFHGKNVPAITILSYLSRIHKYCPTTFEVFLSLLVYFDRMTERVNEIVMKDQEAKKAALASQPAQADVTMEDVTSVKVDDSSDSDNLEDRDLVDDDSDSDDEREQLINGTGGSKTASGANSATITSQPTFFVVDSFNIHRLIIAGVTCASKFFSDVFYTNSRYAKV